MLNSEKNVKGKYIDLWSSIRFVRKDFPREKRNCFLIKRRKITAREIGQIINEFIINVMGQVVYSFPIGISGTIFHIYSDKRGTMKW